MNYTKPYKSIFINENQLDKFRDNRNKRYIHYVTPGYGFLSVNIMDLIELDMSGNDFEGGGFYIDIKKQIAYLGESDDKYQFIKFFKNKYGKEPTIVKKYTNRTFDTLPFMSSSAYDRHKDKVKSLT